MEYEEFTKSISVSRETHLRLLRYVELLEEWGSAINLVSSNENLWHRHIIDSAQMANYVDSDASKRILDLGSGGGLPGIVLAVMMPNPITLVESDRRKSLFLKHCIHELKLTHAEVENQRIEKCELEGAIIVARALAPLNDLFGYVRPFLLEDSTCLFPKGRNYVKECEEASRFWEYEKEVIPSLSGDGALLRIRKIRKK
ncbi:MAG: 16S rRNA (guanine(527)-N(7))-methyltransferase RsmG [Rickettsiales bacterium]|nr:16S rRNA (guanine(527)-N(7))-methyltransferase RsmG [Rickettsiales bacterium]